MSDAAEDLFSRALTYSAVGELRLTQGQFAGAISALERSLVLCESVPIFFPWTAASLGYARALVGRIGDGLPLIEQGVAEERIQRGTFQVVALARLGEAYLLADRMDEALRSAQETLALSSELKQRGTQGCALRLPGEIASHRDSPEVETAEQHYREALALADKLGMRPLVAHCHLGLGKLFRRTGMREQAQERLTAATTMYREMGMGCWLEEAEAESAQIG
jgi:tetratricopeptide (TPR) repeat protein